MAPVFPARAASSGAGWLPAAVHLQPSFFPRTVSAFMPQLWQKMHAFTSAKLTCNRKHYIRWKEKPPGWERRGSLLPSPWRPSSEPTAARDWG